MSSSRVRGLLQQLGPAFVGIGLVIMAWSLVALVLRSRHIVPYPWEVGAQLVADRSLLVSNTRFTLRTAVRGLVFGVLVVLPFVAVASTWPTLRAGIDRMAVVIHIIPFIAIAPILFVSLQADTARVTVSALQVYFPMYVGLSLGLAVADLKYLDVSTVAGGRGWAAFRFVRVPTAAASAIAAMKIVAPAAILGALIGEFFGSDRGLGAILVNSQESLLIERTWAIALTIGLVATGAFAVVAVIGWLLRRWTQADPSTGTTIEIAARSRSSSKTTKFGSLAAVVLLIVMWAGLRPAFGLSEYFVKSPVDVVRFLISGNERTGVPASMFWTAFGKGLATTLFDALIGFVVGSVLAVVLAGALVAAPRVRSVVMPMAIVLRSLPLVAVTPLLVLIFGRGVLGVTVLVTLVTFFPTLVNVMSGLESSPLTTLDLVKVSGGSPMRAARLVRLPYAVPSMLASARIAIPAAIVGATLAEWLATGRGLGQLLTLSYVQADYLTLWSGGALLVVVVLLLYSLISFAASAIAHWMGQ